MIKNSIYRETNPEGVAELSLGSNCATGRAIRPQEETNCVLSMVALFMRVNIDNWGRATPPKATISTRKVL
jgi:hypothetical protein